MASSNYLQEIKKEYTIQLINMLTPPVYEGINSIYSEVKAISAPGEELKVFQGFLQKIPLWNEEMISTEAKRIKTVVMNSDIIDDLIKAVIQSNILLLTATDISEKHRVLKEFNLTLNYNKFIHNVYIEVAKVFYNYPFLFYDKLPALEYKKNQLKAHKLIKESIEEAIRKMLPLQLILKKYLGIMSEINDNKYIKPLVNTESNNNQYQLINNNQQQPQNNQNKNHALEVDDSNDSDDFIQQKGGDNNNVPSLKEIYNQQKMYSPSVKPIPITASENRKDYRKSEGKINIVIPANQASQINQNQYQNQNNKNMNMNSETSQAYHNQEGAVEEECSNMKDKRNSMSNMKTTLNPISEHDTSQTESNKNKVYNYRKF
jgi:hypothetical protein